MPTAAVLLAAGTSKRFGAKDKLLANYKHKPLVNHAADAIRCAKFEINIAIVTNPHVASLLKDFNIINLKDSNNQQSASLKAGVLRAMQLQADKVLILLGDMPNIAPTLLHEVTKTCTASHPSATRGSSHISPPACFHKNDFSELLKLSGDKGALSLLQTKRETKFITVDDDHLLDVDFPSQIE